MLPSPFPPWPRRRRTPGRCRFRALIPLLLCGALAAWPAVPSAPLSAQPAAPAAPAASAGPGHTVPLDTSPPVRRVLRVHLDNDLFSLRDSAASSDYDYTHGVGVIASWADAPHWLRRRAGNAPGCLLETARHDGCMMATFGVRQAIYTPASNRAAPVPGQRPHAGYLGVVVASSYITPHRVRGVQLDLGTTGRPALAEQLHQATHALTGTQRELGWRNQLPARPAFALRYEEQYVADVRGVGARLRTRAYWNAQAGNLRTAALAGAHVQLGFDRPLLWMPGDEGLPLPLGAFLLFSAQQETVAHDLFVDGHPGDHRVTSVRVPHVWQTTLGFGWRYPGGRFEYRHVRRSKEYEAQLGTHTWGSLALSFNRR